MNADVREIYCPVVGNKFFGSSYKHVRKLQNMRNFQNTVWEGWTPDGCRFLIRN
jgi:hypothetical protein